MKTRYLFSALALILSLSACSNDSRKDVGEREQQVLQNQAAQKEAEFAPIAGHYKGELTKPDGTVKKVSLVLVPSIMIVQNPGRNDVSEIPTLAGGLNLLITYSDGREDVLPVAQYTVAKYETTTRRLRMSGSINSPGGTIGNILNTLDGYFHGDRITAQLTNTTLGDVGIIDVVRVGSSN